MDTYTYSDLMRMFVLSKKNHVFHRCSNAVVFYIISMNCGYTRDLLNKTKQNKTNVIVESVDMIFIQNSIMLIH